VKIDLLIEVGVFLRALAALRIARVVEAGVVGFSLALGASTLIVYLLIHPLPCLKAKYSSRMESTSIYFFCEYL
jgi:hypothetical protein